MSRFFAAGRRSFARRPLVSSALAAGTGCLAYSQLVNPNRDEAHIDAEALYFGARRDALRMDQQHAVEGTLDRPATMWTPPSREEMLQKLGCPPLEGEAQAPKTRQSGLDDDAAKQDSQSRGVNRPGQQDSAGSTSEPPSAQPGRTTGPNAGSGDADKDDGEFDLLIVGGGATGAGVALDAAARGLKVGMVERDDFSSGASRLLWDPCIRPH